MTAGRGEPRDIVHALTAAGAAPRRVLELNDGRALAHWHNHHGEACYERPRHHALSIYTQGGERTTRQVNGQAVSGQFSRAKKRALANRIEENLAQPLDLATMSEWTSLSPYHFARLFRASFGLAPYQYVQEQRLLQAKHLLHRRSAKITAVALECGFTDHSQFSRAFRKRFGMSPSQYRNPEC